MTRIKSEMGQEEKIQMHFPSQIVPVALSSNSLHHPLNQDQSE